MWAEVTPTMDWKQSLESSSLTTTVAIPGLTQFQAVCTERGRQIGYQLHGYLDLEDFQWKWKASVVDIVTGIDASFGGSVSKGGTMEQAMKILFEKIEENKACAGIELGTINASGASSDDTAAPHHETSTTVALQPSRAIEPKLPELLNEVAARVPHIWRLVGDQLEIPPGNLESFFMQNNGRPMDCFREVLIHWRKNPKVAYSWESMVKVLQSAAIGEQDLAKIIMRDHC